VAIKGGMMYKLRSSVSFLGLLALLLLLGGCFSKVYKTPVNYYVLDYQNNSEDPKLIKPVNTGKILEVQNTYLPKTYDRNQIVSKENFYRVRFMQNELWANKLRDAIPNLVAQRLRAYNIFSNITRGEQTDKNPDFFLETNVLNIEKIEKIGDQDPQAYLRIEFVLHDSTGSKILFTHKHERYTDLVDPSMISLVQAFNEMLMDETNIFSAMCLRYFSGGLQPERSSAPQPSYLEKYFYEKMSSDNPQPSWGELMVNTKTVTDEQIKYSIVGLDSLNNEISSEEWEAGKPASLKPGRYNVVMTEDIVIPVVIKPMQRSVVKPTWAELQIKILDESQTRVRMSYDIWKRSQEMPGYNMLNSGISTGDDEIGGFDKLWILKPGSFLVKLGGGHWSDLKNFATVSLAEGERKTLTIIADPNAETNYLIGAGVFADDDLGNSAKRWHKGAIHGNISLASDNKVDKNKPTNGLTLYAQFDNTIDSSDQIKPFHFTAKSLYELGLNLSSATDLNFRPDDYSLKSVLLLYPMEKKAFFKNFAFYGRADVNTHFFDETTFFTNKKNIILRDSENNQLSQMPNQSSLETKIALYPLRLKEGAGLTYRINFTSNSWTSLRVGYGWQQDNNHLSYAYTGQTTSNGLVWDIYTQDKDRTSKGIESTVILSAMNLLKFCSINSTLDMLFPMGEEAENYRLDNENRINFKIYRNISLDVKLNLQYDKSVKDWVVYDYTSYLRLSLFY